MNVKKIFFVLALAIVFTVSFAVPKTALAAGTTSGCPSYLDKTVLCQDNTGAADPTKKVNSTIGSLIKVAFGVAGVVVLAYIMWAGFKFMTSGGEAEKKQEAQKQIVAAVIGLLIIVFAFLIVNVVATLFNVHLDNLDLSGSTDTPSVTPTT